MKSCFANRSACARALALALALVLALAVPALWAQAGQPEIAATVVRTDRYPQHNASFGAGVTGLPDLTYTSQPGFRPLKLDLYLPPPSFRHTPRPLVIYVHGGHWMGGSPRTSGAFANWPEALASLAARGYVVASVGYRLAGEAKFPAAIQDVKDAIRWLRSKANVYNIDKRRALIWGASAGGHLAALAATSCGVKALERPARAGSKSDAAVEANQGAPSSAESACLQGAVVWYGVADFAPLSEMKEANRLLGCSADRGDDCAEDRRVASPVTYVNERVPPFLIIHGEEDRTIPAAQARAMYDAIRAHNGHAELMLIPGIDHSFLGKTPAATRDASLKAWDRTVGFIDRTVGDAGRRERARGD